MRSLNFCSWDRSSLDEISKFTKMVMPYKICDGVELQEQDEKIVVCVADDAFCELNGVRVFELAELITPSCLVTEKSVFRIFADKDANMGTSITESIDDKRNRLQKLFAKSNLAFDPEFSPVFMTDDVVGKKFDESEKSPGNDLFGRHNKGLLAMLIATSVLGFVLGIPRSILSGAEVFVPKGEIAQVSEPAEPKELSTQSAQTSDLAPTESVQNLPTSELKSSKNQRAKVKKLTSSSKKTITEEVPPQILEGWKKRHSKALLILGFDPAAARAQLQELSLVIPKSHAYFRIVDNDLKRVK